MEIRNNSTGADGTARIDFTQANCESIRARNPLPPTPEPIKGTPSGGTPGKRIADARDIAAAAASVHKRISTARDASAAAASVHKRIEGARSRVDTGASKDTVTVSTNAQSLADAVVTLPASDATDSARAQRVSELKAQFRGGHLDVGSLVAETAYRMLGGA